jgi:hypothetical protein
MTSLVSFLDQLYAAQERMTRDEIQRRAVAAELPAETMSALDALPEGTYSFEEVTTAIAEVEGGAPVPESDGEGVPATALPDDDLMRELGAVHRTRHDTLRHGSAQALEHHTERMTELEQEYLRRFPEREVDPEREREGARQRTG